MKISELIKELEKIKAEHGDLPVKFAGYDELVEEFYLGDPTFPEYYKPSEADKIKFSGEKEECVVIGE